jgi:flavodoxin
MACESQSPFAGNLMTPKTLIVCQSVHHRNTAMVAQAMGDVLEADIRTPETAPADKLDDYDLFGFGSGIYFGRFHGTLRDWIDRLPDAPQITRPSFVFSTSGLPMLWRLWHWPLKSCLARKGFRVLGEFHCRGFDTFGPLWLLGGLNRRHPDARDLNAAREFAENLRSSYAAKVASRGGSVSHFH